MTEKRFKLGYVCGDFGLIDNDEWIDLHSMSENSEKNVRICINKMNELSDENEQLKEALIELKEIGDYQYARIKELSDENEQLEQTNQRLTIALKEIKEKTNIYLEMTKKGEDQP